MLGQSRHVGRIMVGTRCHREMRSQEWGCHSAMERPDVQGPWVVTQIRSEVEQADQSRSRDRTGVRVSPRAGARGRVWALLGQSHRARKEKEGLE